MIKSKILELIQRKGIRKLLRENYLLLPLVVLFIFSSFGFYTPAGEYILVKIVGSIAIASYSIAAFHRYVFRQGGDFQYVEVVGALILAINYLVQLTGGLHSFWFGLYMLLMIAVGINYSLRISLLTVMRVGLLEGFNALATALRTDQHFEAQRLLLWLLMLVLVAIVGELSLTMLKRRLSAAEREVESTALRAEEEARERSKFLPVLAETIASSGQPGLRAAEGPSESGLDFETAFLRHVKASLEAAHVCFFLRDSSGVFRLRWAAGSDATADFDDDAAFVVGQGLLGYCAKNRTSLSGKRTSGSTTRSAKVDFAYLRSGAESVRAYLVEPVVHAEEAIGVLVADRGEGAPGSSGTPVDFAVGHQLLMKSAVGILELEWQRCQAAQMHRQSNEILTTFFRIISRMSATLNIDEVAALLVKESKNLLRYDTAAVALVPEGGESYTLLCAEGFDFDSSAQISNESKTWTRWAIGSVEDALLISDFHRRQGQMPIYTPTETPLEVGSFLAIPLGPPARRRGAFILTHRQASQFSTEAEQLLRLLCRHAAIIIENAVSHRKMETLAVTDELTQLPNHRCFQDRLEEEISRARRTKKPLSLLMVDIDLFKKLNDTYGHPFGDAVLSQIAEIIERCLRREDFAARYGGEEFGLILPDTNRDGARQTAERLRSEVNNSLFTREGNSAHVSISGGMATYPRDATSKEQLIENADRALYVAKRAGRNRIAQFHVIDTMQLPIEFSG
jgi:diguanylate cyclase (GGDEF)-like protein